MDKERKSKIAEKLTTYLFYLSILFFLIAFNFQDSRTGGWYQQFMLDLGGRTISDITFTDSLTGYATAQTSSDSNFILKTTNGGDNWIIVYKVYRFLTRVEFINSNTGFVGGSVLLKTTNAGINWNVVNTLFDPKPYEIFVFNQDTIWYSDTDPLVGGMFRTTNGGGNWQKLDNGVNQPWPDKIYFYNNRLGFASNYSHLYRTTNSGVNWSMVTGTDGYNDIVFSDSLTGYKTYDSVRKTTNGGLNWIAQQRPKLNINNSFNNFSIINKDTIWGCGGTVLTSLGVRGVIYITTNGGLNWGYQIPDTININIARYIYSDFINKRVGWAYIPYGSGPILCGGVHTTVGGNEITYYTGFKIISNYVPERFTLGQNYPNPFNPLTNIPFEIKEPSYIILKVYNVSGRLIKELINGRWGIGKFIVDFDAANLPSGIYFYKIGIFGEQTNEKFLNTKKMVVIK